MAKKCGCCMIYAGLILILKILSLYLKDLEYRATNAYRFVTLLTALSMLHLISVSPHFIDHISLYFLQFMVHFIHFIYHSPSHSVHNRPIYTNLPFIKPQPKPSTAKTAIDPETQNRPSTLKPGDTVKIRTDKEKTLD